MPKPDTVDGLIRYSLLYAKPGLLLRLPSDQIQSFQVEPLANNGLVVIGQIWAIRSIKDIA